MNKILRFKSIIVIVNFILLVLLALSIWKMIYFRNKANNILSNEHWETFIRSTIDTSCKPIVLFGDSQIAFWPIAITYGASYVLNRGVGGDRADSSIHRFRRDVINVNPSQVIILIGTNDLSHQESNQNIVKNIQKMAEEAIANSIRPIVILPVRPKLDYTRPVNKIIELNSQLQSMCQKKRDKRIFFIDIYKTLCDTTMHLREDFSRDGLHINQKAYSTLTRQINDSLEQWRMLP